jgi:hypothetical protein
MVRSHPDPWRLPESEWWNHDGGYDQNLDLRSKNIRGRKSLNLIIFVSQLIKAG